MSKYNVVRLNYAIKDSTGAFHQSHYFSSHRSLTAAVSSAEKLRRTYNCVDIVDENGKKVEVAA